MKRVFCPSISDRVVEEMHNSLWSDVCGIIRDEQHIHLVHLSFFLQKLSYIEIDIYKINR